MKFRGPKTLAFFHLAELNMISDQRFSPAKFPVSGAQLLHVQYMSTIYSRRVDGNVRLLVITVLSWNVETSQFYFSKCKKCGNVNN